MSAHEPLSDHDVFALFPNVMIDRDNIAHYRALAAGHLAINRCGDCGYWVYPHRPMCPECLSWNVTPTEVSGQGRVFMFTLIHQLRDPHSNIMEPVVVAAIELVEQAGLRYLSRIVNCPLEEITLDMPVSLTWIPEGAPRSPAFEPASAQGLEARG
ncbi:MAG: hypothetical protein EPO08_16230 [Rhodospirillaceae bacterium]|nr:MAG: hypothetical protein EPO08_16230 [Rhodospirillaceae bacterium]